MTTATTATTVEAQCTAWRAIRYHHDDTAKTVQQVRVHNKTGQNLKCWK